MDYKYATLILFLVACSFSLGWVSHINYLNFSENANNIFSDVSKDEIDLDLISQRCEVNASLPERVKCMNDFVSRIYKYKIRFTGDVEFTDLVENGGDCGTWANFYLSLAEILDIPYYEKIIIFTSEDSSHAFTVVSDTTGYCILDQTHYWCFKFGNYTTMEEDNKIE